MENLRLLESGQADVAIAVNAVAADAVTGVGEFAGEALDFAFIGNLYGEVTQIVATAESGITTIADLEGKRVALGPPRSGTEVMAQTILEARGIDPDTDIDATNDTFGEAAVRLRDGQLDAAFGVLALPAGAIEEVANSVDITIVTFEGDLMDALLYGDATLYARADLDEGLIYDLTRVLYVENVLIANSVAVGGQVQLETAVLGNDIEVHPGAQRFYNER